MSYLEISDARKSYGALNALDGVSLSVPKGGFATLLGPSGCGKTTLLRAIAGLHALDSGSIAVEGRELNAPGGGGPKAVMVFQDYALFPHMNVRRNVSYGLTARKAPGAEIRAKVDEVLGYLGIGELGARLPSELSGGQQQRVALARALVMEPEVLLLDEPLSNLDAKLRLGIRSELKRIQQDLGVTSVYVTHDQGEALALSDLVAVMDRGRIVQTGSPREVYLRPASAFVADFVGTTNILSAKVLRAGVESSSVFALGRAWQSSQGLPANSVGKTLSICVRPESVRILEVATGNSIDGVVAQKSFEGSHVRYLIETADAVLAVDDAETGRDLALNGRVALGIPPEGIRILQEDPAWTR